ncbi:MAG: alpha/beta hydrolase [Planctomycetota bacterium]
MHSLNRFSGRRRRRVVSPATALAALVVGGVWTTAARSEPPIATSSTSLVREAANYGWRTWVRRRVMRKVDADRYGLRLDAEWGHRAERLPVVVLIHGFNSTPQRNRSVLKRLVTRGYPCGGFAYPNDHGLAASAELLSRELREFALRHPDRQVALITHSMGGLIARACIEDPRLDPGNVDRLIMIAPPNHGTHLAHAAVATDVWEHWLGRRNGGCWARWRDSVIDGLGEAADDLAPGSRFLTQLNRRQRNADVHYTIFLGTDAAVKEGEMAWLRSAIRKTGGRLPGVRTAAGRLDGWLEDMDEVVIGRGDGVVAVKRGVLDGVDDVMVLPFDHLTVTATPRSEAVRRVHHEVTVRLN